MDNNTGSAACGLGPQKGRPLPGVHPKLGSKAVNHGPASRRQATVTGQVMVVGDFPRTLFNGHNDTKHSGVVLKTEGDRLVVHLGPAWYFQEHDFPIKIGDMLEVCGSRMTSAGHAGIMIAEKVRNQEKTLRIPNKF